MSTDLPIPDFLPDYPYLARLAFRGRIWLQCPSCGLITCNKIVAGQYQLECASYHNECGHKVYGFGMRIFPIPRGPATPPTDHITVAGLREAFPAGEMFRWRSGEMAHQLVPGGRELAREFVRQVRSRAAEGGAVGVGVAFEQVAGEWGLEGPEE